MKNILKSKAFLVSFACFWFIAVAIPVGYLMGSHQAFNDGVKIDVLKEVAAAERSVLHMIGADCKCSVKLARYLSDRGPLKNIQEKVIVVGKNAELVKQLSAAHFSVEEMNSELAL